MSAPPAPASAGRRGIVRVIAAKNLFSPTRSEAAAGPVVAAGPKPILHGVVVDGPKSRAFLEDPVVKRTFGYAVGDTVGGGRVESDQRRPRGDRRDPTGCVEVLLQDPAKPRPAPAAPGARGAAGRRRRAGARAGVPRAAAGRADPAATRRPAMTATER